MFAPNYKEISCVCKIVRRGSGDDLRFVPALPEIQFGLVLCFVGGINYYAYPLPADTEGKDAICHVVYQAKDSEVMDKFAGKLGLGNEVTKLPAYKALVTQTVGMQKIAEEKARITQEAEAKGEVVKQADLDAVKYDGADSSDGVPLWVFQNKEYIDK